MRDIDVRRALYARSLDAHVSEPDTLVIDELGLDFGRALVDVAVINGFLHGYEIKSERDTLGRLPSQEPVYSAVLDLATLVVHESHLERAQTMIPEWWGIRVVFRGPNREVEFRDERLGAGNPSLNPVTLLGLLWREEALAVLETRGLSTGFRSRPKRVLYARIAECLSLDEVRNEVRRALKSRVGWRVAPRRM